ncbi:MAG: efflux RND transporter permease subunit [Candidatus Cyclobacteriaceae bacterium M2_1C_046]
MIKMEPQQKIDKEFKLTTVSLKNRTTVYFLTFLIVVVGILSYMQLPKDSYPEIEQPTVYIGTPYPGNAPIDMENLVTRPIEKEINTISEVDNIKSTSIQDHSTIIVEFTAETDVQKALTKVKDAVDRAKPELPTDLPSDPNVFELNFSEFPIMNINLSGEFALEDLKYYAEYLEDEIEKISEISKVEIRGLDEKEVQIKVNPYAMEARKVNFTDIENAISTENVTMSGGSIVDDGMKRTIRVTGEFTDPREMEDVIIKFEKGNIVYLGDVAEIEFDYKDKTSYARLNKNPVVSVDVVKRSGENLLIATEKINETIERAKKDVLPEGLTISITNDQSEFTKEMVSSLENNIISGVILVVLVLLFFLGTRNALFVGVAIPLSMFITFIALGALGITINMMVLFSLIMALGMLVDNGIVVVENVYRLMEEGYSAWDATRLGVGEVAWPIIASTATTLAAFLPLAFWPGLMGQFMRYLPITLIITLTSSLFVALVINPVLISSFMKITEKGSFTKRTHYVFLVTGIIGVILVSIGLLNIGAGVGAANLPEIFTVTGNLLLLLVLISYLSKYILKPISDKFQQTLLPWLEDFYDSGVKYALKGYNPWFYFWGTVLALFGAVGLMRVKSPEVIFFPINEPKYVNVFVEFPIGTEIETTNRFTAKIENTVMDIVEPYDYMVESVVTKVGQDTSDPNDPSAVGKSETPNNARITVNFAKFQEREGQSTTVIMEKIRDSVQGYPGVTITVDKDRTGPPVGKPISIEVTGENYATLVEVAERMRMAINESDIKGIEKLKFDLETGKPELIVDIDREKARRFGLSSYTIANELRTSLFGKEISTYKEGEEDYEIQLRLADQYRYDLDALMNKQITFKDQTSGTFKQIPISSVAEAQLSSTYGSVKRKDLKKVITLSSNVEAGYNPTEINEEIKGLLSDFPMPTGYTFKFGGEQEKQAEEMSFLSGALLLAVFLIFLIIVAQFNKLTAPLIIMTTVLFSTIGVLIGLVIFDMDFVVIMTMIGIISLAGIVVNNAIVLIDFIELKRGRMQEELGVERLDFDHVKAAIADAGKVRLRPVLLTAITTILGLIPLATGLNIDFIGLFSNYDPDFYIGGDNAIFWGPMSWTIIFGLTFATFLTLIVVPVMYLFFARINRKLGIS